MIPTSKALRRHETHVIEVGPLAHRPAQAAQRLGIGLTTFRKHVLPKVATFNVGDCVLIPDAELVRYVEEKQRPPAPMVVPTPVDAPTPIAIERAMGRTTRRPRLHRKEDRQAG